MLGTAIVLCTWLRGGIAWAACDTCGKLCLLELWRLGSLRPPLHSMPARTRLTVSTTNGGGGLAAGGVAGGT